MDGTRPTLRCLRDDLCLPVPPADEPLDEVQHPLLAKAVAQFAGTGARYERIRSIDDQVLFKVKVQRWRGAVWTGRDRPWLVAAGWREDGSGTDFYAALEARAKATRTLRRRLDRATGTATTDVSGLLPNQDDEDRLHVEAGTRLLRRLTPTIHDLVRDSLHDGYEHVADLTAFTVGVQVRADNGHETYAAVRITGSVPDNLAAIVLDLVPGCDRAGWFPEARLPDRPLSGAEQAWSNLMDPVMA